MRHEERRTKERTICGLDFGTSNTAIALWDNDKHAIVEGSIIMEPTLMHFPRSDSSLKAEIGEAAVSSYIKSGMTGRFFQAIKTTLPQPSFTHTRVNGVKMEIEELCAIILRYFKAKAEECCGEKLENVVMGRPAVFSADPEKDALAQKRLHEAAKRAGFTSITFQYEPIAAALEYESGLKRPETVLVGDFGGGTSDFTVMRLDPKKVGTPGRKEDILITAGVPVAGNRMDSAVMYDHLLPLFGSKATYANHSGERLPAKIYAHADICEWDKIHHLKQDKMILERIEYMITRSNDPEGFMRLRTLIMNNYGFGLFKAIEACKIELSEKTQEELRYQVQDLAIEAPLSRESFERTVADEVQKIEQCLEDMLSKAEIKKERIDTVFLTGGTAQLPVIRNFFVKNFGLEKINTKSFFTSVVRGLALSAPMEMT